MAYKQDKVLTVAEGGCGTLLVGLSGLPIKELEAELNKHAAGWRYFGVSCNFTPIHAPEISR